MKRIFFLALSLLTMTATYAQKKNVEVKIIQTSDVHGMFFPTDYITGKRIFGTMARISSYIKRQRASYGDNLILVDNGDMLQGQPANYYYNFVNTNDANIASSVANYLQYDAMVLGNHDIETGHACYDKFIKEVNCPVLGANVINTSTNEPYTKPYQIFEKEGVKIAILGMTTPAIPNWYGEEAWSGMRFEDIATSARKWVKILKEEEKADAIIGLFHCGLEGGIINANFKENAVKEVAEQVPGFDAILYGHDHKITAGGMECTDGNSVMIVNPGTNARVVGDIELSFVFEDGKLREKYLNAQTVQMDPESTDQDFMNHFQKEANDVQAFCSQKIATLDFAIFSRDAFFGNSAFVDLIHNLQLSITNADISISAPLLIDGVIKQGDLTMANMFNLYKAEDHLYVINMTGEEIRKHLEMSYALWTNQMHSAKDHLLLLNNDEGKMLFLNPIDYFDSAAGIDYEVDVTKPQGQKIKILRMSNGEPFSETKTYKVAMNSYRANGGGELLTKGAGIPKNDLASRIVSRSEKDLRQLLAGEIKKLGRIIPKSNTNWKFVPESMVKPALDRDKEALYKKTAYRIL